MLQGDVEFLSVHYATAWFMGGAFRSVEMHLLVSCIIHHYIHMYMLTLTVNNCACYCF